MQRSDARVWRTVAAIIVLVVACVSCTPSRRTEVGEEFVVSGVVHAGPTCPVERDPPDPDCADRPVPDAAIVITHDDGEEVGEEVGEVLADDTGRFTVQLPEGTYTLTPQPVEGLMGTPAPQIVTVGPALTDIDFAYDTGIR